MQSKQLKSDNAARVTVGLTDIRKRPDVHSERVTQAPWGTEVKKSGKEIRGFVKVELPDKYSGYIRNSHLRPLPSRIQNSIRISVSHIPVYFAPSERSDILFMSYFNTEFSKLRAIKEWTEVILDDDRTGWIPNGTFKIIKQRLLDRHRLKDIIRTAKSFIGTPYLWGGITPCGWDCSGFIQAIFKASGTIFPRDTIDQVKRGHPVKFGNHRKGDLIFFTGHVGLAISKGIIIHSSIRRGGVFIDEIGPDADDFGKILFNDIKAVKRIFTKGA